MRIIIIYNTMNGTNQISLISLLNRQTIMKNRQSQLTQFSLCECQQTDSFQQMTAAYGRRSFLRADSSKPLLDGIFEFQSRQGLTMHCSNATELQETSHSIELLPGLSFNIIFRGRVEFSLGENLYQFGLGDTNKVECVAIILSKPEIMTRYLKKGVSVKKVNVRAEKSWLESRCEDSVDKKTVQKVFSQHNSVYRWQPSESIVAITNSIMDSQEADQKLKGLTKEYLMVQLLSLCLNELESLIDSKKNLSLASGNIEAESTADELRSKVDHLVSKNLSLNEIASSLGLSLSTLQRKFKNAFGLTVAEYIRQRRLEIARAALTLEGISIGEAAFIAGYNHPSNFIAAFKKQFLVTPANLVKMHNSLNPVNNSVLID